MAAHMLLCRSLHQHPSAWREQREGSCNSCRPTHPSTGGNSSRGVAPCCLLLDAFLLRAAMRWHTEKMKLSDQLFKTVEWTERAAMLTRSNTLNVMSILVFNSQWLRHSACFEQQRHTLFEWMDSLRKAKLSFKPWYILTALFRDFACSSKLNRTGLCCVFGNKTSNQLFCARLCQLLGQSWGSR